MTDQWETTKPDWGREADQFAGVIDDPIEAMATIGAPAVRRTGRIMWVSGFELDLHEMIQYDPSASLDSAIAQYGSALAGVPRGSYALSVTPPTLTPFWATANKHLAKIWSGNLGLEITVGAHVNATAAIFGFDLWADGAHKIAQIRIDLVDQDLEYMSSFGATPNDRNWTKFDDQPGGDMRTLNPGTTALKCANCKLVVSSDLSEYLRFYFNDRDYWDLSGNAIPTKSEAGFEILLAGFQAEDSDGTQGYVIYDDCIVTQDEP